MACERASCERDERRGIGIADDLFAMSCHCLYVFASVIMPLEMSAEMIRRMSPTDERCDRQTAIDSFKQSTPIDREFESFGTSCLSSDAKAANIISSIFASPADDETISEMIEPNADELRANSTNRPPSLQSERECL